MYANLARWVVVSRSSAVFGAISMTDLPSSSATGQLYSPHQLRQCSGDLRLSLCREVRPEARSHNRKLTGCAGGKGLSCHRESPHRRGESDSRSNVAPMG